MAEPTWSHGYFPNALYTCGFYRKMAPNWLDFAALVKGHRPTRREGQRFRYLELGSGMGLHLCLLLHLADAHAAELEPRSFDYVVPHGVLTWVAPPVQQALLSLTGQLLTIGGLFCCSYNTLPGWQAAEIYQHLAEQERSCGHPAKALGGGGGAGSTAAGGRRRLCRLCFLHLPGRPQESGGTTTAQRGRRLMIVPKCRSHVLWSKGTISNPSK